MKLCTYTDDSAQSKTAGILVGDRVVPLADAVKDAGLELQAVDVVSVLAASATTREALREAADRLVDAHGRPVGELTLLPPVPNPDKIICLGLNYRDHAEEAGLPLPQAPVLFFKHTGSLLGHGGTIVPPAGESTVDYEGELAVVIGRQGKDISAADALEHVGGYMPFNDVSARDLQLGGPQWTAGKAVDTFGPCGPWVTSAEEVPDPQAMRILTRVNGQTLQDGDTADMVFSVAEQIAFISSVMTLLPGDLIVTGTPAGVGFTRDPQVLLTDGDEVEVEIPGLGTLGNVVAPARVPVTPVRA